MSAPRPVDSLRHSPRAVTILPVNISLRRPGLPMRVRCPECDSRVRVPNDDPHTRVKCPECGERFRPSDLDDPDIEPSSRMRKAARTDNTKLLVILGAVCGAGLLLAGLAVVGVVLVLNNRSDVAETPTAPAVTKEPPPPRSIPPRAGVQWSPVPVEPPPVPPPQPVVPEGQGTVIGKSDKPPTPRPAVVPTINDLKVPSVKVSSEWSLPRQVREVLPCLTWAADGKAFYALDQGGNAVRRFSFPDLNEEAKLAVGKEMSWLSLSKEGPVVTVSAEQQAWVLDPVTLAKVRTFPVGKALRVLSAASLGVGYVCNTEERQNFGDVSAYRPHGGVLRVIDLKTGQQVKEYDVQSLDKKGTLHAAVISADGKHLFTVGGLDQLQQYALDGEKVTFVTTSPQRLIQGGFLQPVVSADGKLVSAPSGGGNMLVKNGHAVINHNTCVFAPGNLNDPLLNLETGPYPIAIGFDTKAGLIYAQNHKYHLIVLDQSGVTVSSNRLVSFRLNGMDGGGVRQFLPHPDGGKLLVLVAHGLSGTSTAFAVEVPKN